MHLLQQLLISVCCAHKFYSKVTFETWQYHSLRRVLGLDKVCFNTRTSTSPNPQTFVTQRRLCSGTTVLWLWSAQGCSPISPAIVNYWREDRGGPLTQPGVPNPFSLYIYNLRQLELIPTQLSPPVGRYAECENACTERPFLRPTSGCFTSPSANWS